MIKILKTRMGDRKRKYSLGFTLAEVLITLVIIGIIAAVTVPAIIQQTQKQEYVVGLKKAYSTLQNALYKMADNNGYPHGDYTFLRNISFMDEFAKVANLAKRCDTTSECFPSTLHKDRGTVIYKRLNDTLVEGWEDGKTVITNDGQMYSELNLVSYDSTSIYGLSEENKTNLLKRILVDLNGWKSPNKFGYDVFVFYLHPNQGIIPAGLNDTSNCTKSSHGYSCAAKVLKENKIDY